MSAFTYRAVNEDNKEVRGQIDAPDMDTAKRSLEAVHLDVVEIHEASRSSKMSMTAAETDPQPVLKTTFAFEGTDSAKSVRRGTIQAETKYQAFERLKHDQSLFVTMLSPLGVTPQYKDNDLENWQRRETEATQPTTLVSKPQPMSPTPKTQESVSVEPRRKTIAFTEAKIEKTSTVRAPEKVDTVAVYHPIISTLRLYAGWLLAWYGLFVALGYYAHVRLLSWDLPFVEAFYLSPLIFSFTVAIFLFLLLGAIHRAQHGHWVSRIVLGLLGIGAFLGVRMSIQ